MEKNSYIDALRKIVKNWKTSYLSQVDSAGGNEYLVQDFWEEIEENILPYGESDDFARWAFQQVKDLQCLIHEIEKNDEPVEMIISESRKTDS